MAWATPDTEATGYDVQAADWNKLVDDLKHLRGLDGETELVGDVLMSGGELQIKDVLILQQISSGTSGTAHLTRNAYYDAGTWKRLVADNDAAALALTADGALVFYTQSDANNTADSAITFAERFKVGSTGPTVRSARAYKTSTQNVGVAADDLVTFAGETHDTGSIHDTGVSTWKFVVPETGLYLIECSLGVYATIGAGEYVMLSAYNGVTRIAQALSINHGATVPGVVSLSDVRRLTAGDEIGFQLFNNTGVTATIAASGDTASYASITKLGSTV